MAATSAPLLVMPASKDTSKDTSRDYGPGLGVYFGAALVVVSLADTRAAPVVVAFLAAAAIYNANYIVNRGSKPPQVTDPFSGKGYRFTW